MRKVTGGEWRWVIVASLLIMAITSVPYLVGVLHSTPEMRFGGFLFALEDKHSYLAKMRYGARNGWLFELVYTPEPHSGGFFFTFHLALGKFTAWLTGQGAMVSAGALAVTYHVARVLCGLLLLGVMYRFVAEFVSEVYQRRFAWGLAAVGGGLGWILVLTGHAAWSNASLPVEFYIPEAFTLLVLFGLPHLSLAWSLLLAGWLALFRALEANNWHRALLAGVAWLAMGVIVPFYVALLGVLIAVWLLGVAIYERRVPWPVVGLAVLAGLPSLAVLGYNAWVFTTNPVFAIWSSQNYLPSPPVQHYLLAFGLQIILAVVGGVAVWQAGLTRSSVLLISWPLAAALMVYLPINVQRRLLEGVILPLTTLATIGLWRLSDVSRHRTLVRGLISGGMLALLLPSTAILLLGGAKVAKDAGWPIYHPADEIAAMEWLRDRAPQDSIVLSTYDSGNLLPAYAGVRVYVGHGPETVDSTDKIPRAYAFFGDGMSDDERRALLEEFEIDYVWVGPPERARLCAGEDCFRPEALGLSAAFQHGNYMIYEVSR